jgi:hypothetical protein
MTTDAARHGLNEALFRSINERIEAGTWPSAQSELAAFRCECAALGCNLMLEMTLGEYEAVRLSPRQFIVAPGHEVSDVEAIVRRTETYLVVEKLGDAGEVAENTDPR